MMIPPVLSSKYVRTSIGVRNTAAGIPSEDFPQTQEIPIAIPAAVFRTPKSVFPRGILYHSPWAVLGPK